MTRNAREIDPSSSGSVGLAIDDPVPSTWDSPTEESDEAVHDVEACISRALKAQPELSFSSLVVRRVPGGVCLEGVLETDVPSDNVTDLVKRVSGLDSVINRLLICRRRNPK